MPTLPEDEGAADPLGNPGAQGQLSFHGFGLISLHSFFL